MHLKIFFAKKSGLRATIPILTQLKRICISDHTDPTCIPTALVFTCISFCECHSNARGSANSSSSRRLNGPQLIRHGFCIACHIIQSMTIKKSFGEMTAWSYPSFHPKPVTSLLDVHEVHWDAIRT